VRPATVAATLPHAAKLLNVGLCSVERIPAGCGPSTFWPAAGFLTVHRLGNGWCEIELTAAGREALAMMKALKAAR
jgi:hypothetical protein